MALFRSVDQHGGPFTAAGQRVHDRSGELAGGNLQQGNEEGTAGRAVDAPQRFDGVATHGERRL